ncbi:50S ribosomal protein L4, chloroplastic-like [Glycine soja]|uniref:50S ribosomal protein L4, chloroplastic-like n=1 Tax=Glycine soja TaxID=3848 RepID=UPI00103ED597|nr:50S ribosomal protein L4, chloroplastic-like [Glycine soja]
MASLSLSLSTPTTPTSLSFGSSSIFFSSHQFHTHNNSFKSNSFPVLPSKKPLSISCKASPPLPVLNFSGERVGESFLDLRSAPPDTARAVVHRAVVTDLQNKRRGTASTLTRGEVRGGGRKPFPQKKTGRARRGSNRTPLRPGGGVIFGPKPRDWSIKINRKEKRLAISTAVASAAASAVVVEDFAAEFAEKPKTKEFIAAMKRWGLDPKEKAMFLMTEVPENVRLSSRNIGTLKMHTPRTLNLYDILDADKLVLTQGAVDYLNQRYGGDYQGSDDEDEEEEEEGYEEGEEEGVVDGEEGPDAGDSDVVN